jgi:hypothetical protein
MSNPRNLLAAFFFSFLALAGTIAIPVLISRGFASQRSISGAPITLPLLAISGVIGLLATLTVVSVAFSAIGLSKPEYALGLPEGSVRAVIALGLVVIFVIVSIFLFGEIEGDFFRSSVPQSLLSSLSGDKVSINCYVDSDNKEVCDVVTRVAKGAASEDFAKQVLTTVSTLVVAVAGFYFGARSVAAAREIKETVSPVIHRVEPPDGKKGDELTLNIFGENFASPEIVRLVMGNKVILCYDILSNPSKIRCQLKIDPSDPDGEWDLIVVNKDGGTGQKDKAFTVTV